MGGIRRGVRAASASSIEITFFYRGERCRERIRLKPTPANLKAAEKYKAAIEDSISKGTFNYLATFPESSKAEKYVERKGQILTVEVFLDAWLERQRKHVKASTFDGYRKIMLNILIPNFGNLKLDALKRATIRGWCHSLECGNKRISNILSPLRIALQEAVDDELIEMNPLYGWSYKRKEAVKEDDDVDPFSPDEQAIILASIDGQFHNLVQFALWTGLRTSEFIALEWGDIDWRRGSFRVSRAKTLAAKDPEVPKTKAGKRDVKLLEPALTALKEQKQHTRLHPSNRVFLNPHTGLPWTGDQQIRSFWTRALTQAKIRYRRPYQTRHTYASMMLSAGESPMWVAQQMGHSDWTMIARVYGRWIPDANPTAGNKALEVFVKTPALRHREAV
ncbi:site-specific integrase [Chitinimonas arctica]|uniref:Site-specific integrase n=1 Tax=Chitinimonas arctica TaxID=2594795 RepID=A0A516SBV1_9NEIS|nr:site-specific integrase [Chitinimonas arctica]QDQ25623.1 site-specific integrase [Chitinimonas arctica]